MRFNFFGHGRIVSTHTSRACSCAFCPTPIYNNKNGTIIQGDYTIEVFSENGNSIGATTFSIIKPSVSQNTLIIENPESEESDTDTNEEIDQTGKTESVEESIEIESELENIQHIPDWVKNIFILYSDGSITENELISALKFLIEQGIIEINS